MFVCNSFNNDILLLLKFVIFPFKSAISFVLFSILLFLLKDANFFLLPRLVELPNEIAGLVELS